MWDAEDNYYYARYRGGCGSVTQYTTVDWVDAPSIEVEDHEPGWGIRSNSAFVRHVADFQYGGMWDGDMTLEEFITHVDDMELADDIVYTGFGDHLRDRLVQESGFTFLLGEDNGTAEV
jgi:hypothetical protein